MRLYDESWAIEGTRVIFGHHQGKGTERSHQLKRSQEQRKLRGFLRLADLGHLAAEGESLVGKKFSRLISGVLSKLETRYGSSLPSKVRSMTAGGGHQLKKGKENVHIILSSSACRTCLQSSSAGGEPCSSGGSVHTNRQTACANSSQGAATTSRS